MQAYQWAAENDDHNHYDDHDDHDHYDDHDNHDEDDDHDDHDDNDDDNQVKFANISVGGRE